MMGEPAIARVSGNVALVHDHVMDVALMATLDQRRKLRKLARIASHVPLIKSQECTYSPQSCGVCGTPLVVGV